MSSPGRYVVAIDVGSSRVRSLVFDLKGALIEGASARTPVSTPRELAPLGKELSAPRLWGLVCSLTKRALRSARVTGQDIVAVSATSQREGVVFLDEAGAEVYAGPNNDLRALMEGQAIDEEHKRHVFEVTGHLPSFLFTPAKLLWFRGHEPEAFHRIAHALSLDAWVAYRLSGVLGIERAAAGEVGLLDIGRGDAANPLLETLGLESRLVPALVGAGEPLGKVTSQSAALTGLSPSTMVVAAGPDTHCGMAALGGLRPGDTGLLAGWSAPVQMVVEGALSDPTMRTWLGRHILPGSWVVESNASDAGVAYQWLVSTMSTNGASDPHAYLERQVARVPPGANGALAYLGPRAADMGNVGPAWGGLLFPLLSSTMPVRPADLFRASLENLAFAIKSNVAQIAEVTGRQPTKMLFGGGMSANRILGKILADVLGIEVLVSRSPEVSALGAAMCAASGSREYASLSEACGAMKGRQKRVAPQPLRVMEYAEYYERWSAMGAVLAGSLDRL